MKSTEEKLGYLNGVVKGLQEDREKMESELDDLKNQVEKRTSFINGMISTVKGIGFGLILLLTMNFGDLAKWFKGLFHN